MQRHVTQQYLGRSAEDTDPGLASRGLEGGGLLASTDSLVGALPPHRLVSMDGHLIVVDGAETVDLDGGPGKVDLPFCCGWVRECYAGFDLLS